MRRLGISVVGVLMAALSLGPAAALVPPAAHPDAVAQLAGADTPESAQRQLLRASVEAAWQTYMTETTRAKAARRKALRVPRADLRDALASAENQAQRLAARQAYSRAASGARAAYRSVRADATAHRTGAISDAVDVYLEATAPRRTAQAARSYRAAVAQAGDTLQLALDVSRASLRTDTADEREDLTIVLAAASSERERNAAWESFQAATSDERAAHRSATKAARAVERSALAKAAREFRRATGRSVRWLSDLAERS